MKQKLLLTVKTWKEGRNFVAYNPELDVASQGNTLAHAQDNLREAVGLFLGTTKRMGTIKEVLREAGFSLESNQKVYRPPHLSFDLVDVNV
ncbi:MAG: type II toxin-antitoxin system HicB family antitoxin [bacterium]|nr:type II toxin-antitoxin system HicB family antitoxin [bacterium]